jgi:ABC-2 type transport system permease protein
MGLRRVRHLFRKELLELRQDPRLLAVVVIAPLLQLTLLGYAATTDVRSVPVVVVDADRTTDSRALVRRFDASPSFRIAGMVNGIGEVDAFLERGDAWLALSIPRGYGRDLAAGRPVTVQVLADGTDANSTNVALGYARGLLAEHGREIAAAHGRRAAPPAIDARIRVWFNPQLESRDFMVPGVVALLLLAVTTNLSSMAVVREKEVGTLEQLNVTPLRRWELIAGKLLPYGMVGMFDVVLVLAVAILWFEIPLRGSPLLLLAMSAVYLLSTLGLGLFVSTVSDTQQQAMMTSVFFFLTPMIYLSGFVFPIENMPAVIQPLTYLIPLRYFLIIVRGIFLKGIGLEVLWPQALALLAWGLTVLGLAVARSRKTLD